MPTKVIEQLTLQAALAANIGNDTKHCADYQASEQESRRTGQTKISRGAQDDNPECVDGDVNLAHTTRIGSPQMPIDQCTDANRHCVVGPKGKERDVECRDVWHDKLQVMVLMNYCYYSSGLVYVVKTFFILTNGIEGAFAPSIIFLSLVRLLLQMSNPFEFGHKPYWC